MHYYDEMSVKEISDALEIPEGTVKSRLNYARKAIKKGVERYAGVNPKFCVNSIWGANRAKFIQGGSRGIRLPPCQQHNAGGVGCQGRRSCSACP